MHHMRSFVLDRFGEHEWERVLSGMSPEDAGEVRALLLVGWHDLGLQHRLLRAIDATLGAGDLALVDEIGRFEADRDLKVVHRLFLRMANPAFVIEKAGQYWSRFYDTGQWEIRRIDSTHAIGMLREVDPFDDGFARYLHAYIHRMWELVGANDLTTSYSIQEEDGGPVLNVEGRWR